MSTGIAYHQFCEVPQQVFKMAIKQALYNQYVTSGQAGVYRNGEDAIQYFAPKKRYIQRVIRKYVSSDRGQRIVDLGAGHGAVLYFLNEMGYSNLAGVDISPEQVLLAHQLGIEHVQLGDIEQFVANESDIGTAFLLDLIEHLTLEQSDRILEMLHQRMRPAGTLILHVPNGEGIYGQRIRYGDLTHETCFTPKSIRQLLRPKGFSSIQCIENKPLVAGIKSMLRRVVWDVGTLSHRVLLAAETGQTQFVLSQNMLVVATKD